MIALSVRVYLVLFMTKRSHMDQTGTLYSDDRDDRRFFRGCNQPFGIF